VELEIVVKIALVLIAYVFLAGAAQAECAAVRAAWRIPDPGPEVEPFNLPPIDDCSPEESAMFRANFNAIAEAVPIASPDEVYGTWLGDDVFLQSLGIVPSAQEVLRISPGQGPDTLEIEQFLFVPLLSASQPHFEDGQYVGWVVRGTLESLEGQGRYRVPILVPLEYGNSIFSDYRGEDLFFKTRMNHFDREVGFRRVGDTLVLESEVLDYGAGPLSANLTTYTRVKDEAPNIAIGVVVAFGVAQVPYFECLTFQLSEGKGPIFDTIAPAGQDDLVALLEDLLAKRALFTSARAQLEEYEPLSEEQEATLLALGDRQLAAQETPLAKSLQAALTEGGTKLGCPDLY
jgi:hypothetical protein